MASLAFKSIPTAGAVSFTAGHAGVGNAQKSTSRLPLASKKVNLPLKTLNATKIYAKKACDDAAVQSESAALFSRLSVAVAATFTLTYLLVPTVNAGPLSDLLPDSAPPAPVEKFERDLGEGRKVRVKDAVPPKDTEVGRLPAPLPYAKATRASVETEIDPGTPPGISREKPVDSVAAPLSYSKPRPQS
eukprot:jgi/Botrbrau1/2350/Bobra.39_1s0035.1